MNALYKRGISPVIATILLVLITVAAVGIAWTFVLPFIQNQLGSFDCDSADISINPQENLCYDETQNLVVVPIMKGATTQDVQRVQFVFSFPDGDKTNLRQVDLSQNQKTSFYFQMKTKPTQDNIPTKISLAPVLVKGTKQKTCAATLLINIPKCTPLETITPDRIVVSGWPCSADTDCFDEEHTYCSNKICALKTGVNNEPGAVILETIPETYTETFSFENELIIEPITTTAGAPGDITTMPPLPPSEQKICGLTTPFPQIPPVSEHAYCQNILGDPSATCGPDFYTTPDGANIWICTKPTTTILPTPIQGAYIAPISGNAVDICSGNPGGVCSWTVKILPENDPSLAGISITHDETPIVYNGNSYNTFTITEADNQKVDVLFLSILLDQNPPGSTKTREQRIDSLTKFAKNLYANIIFDYTSKKRKECWKEGSIKIVLPFQLVEYSIISNDGNKKVYGAWFFWQSSSEYYCVANFIPNAACTGDKTRLIQSGTGVFTRVKSSNVLLSTEITVKNEKKYVTQGIAVPVEITCNFYTDDLSPPSSDTISQRTCSLYEKLGADKKDFIKSCTKEASSSSCEILIDDVLNTGEDPSDKLVFKEKNYLVQTALIGNALPCDNHPNPSRSIRKDDRGLDYYILPSKFGFIDSSIFSTSGTNTFVAKFTNCKPVS